MNVKKQMQTRFSDQTVIYVTVCCTCCTWQQSAGRSRSRERKRRKHEVKVWERDAEQRINRQLVIEHELNKKKKTKSATHTFTSNHRTCRVLKKRDRAGARTKEHVQTRSEQKRRLTRRRDSLPVSVFGSFLAE